MHEILAMVLWCTDLDSVEGTYLAEDLNSLAYLVLSRDYVEHDTYTLFSNLMTNMLSWYDPNLSIPTSFSGSSQLGAPGASIHVQPIVAKCARIHELLKKVDFELWKRMEELQIEPQIYGIRWLRLLFLREFPIAHS
jgi:TBC1 domain family protein 5